MAYANLDVVSVVEQRNCGCVAMRSCSMPCVLAKGCFPSHAAACGFTAARIQRSIHSAMRKHGSSPTAESWQRGATSGPAMRQPQACGRRRPGRVLACGRRRPGRVQPVRKPLLNPRNAVVQLGLVVLVVDVIGDQRRRNNAEGLEHSLRAQQHVTLSVCQAVEVANSGADLRSFL